MVMNGSVDKPHRQAMVVIDTVTGLYGFQAISAALMRKVRFGEGAQFVHRGFGQAAWLVTETRAIGEEARGAMRPGPADRRFAQVPGQIVESAPADQRQPAFQAVAQRVQPVQQPLGHVDVARARRDLHQRAIEIEEQCSGAAVKQLRQRRRGRKRCRAVHRALP